MMRSFEIAAVAILSLVFVAKVDAQEEAPEGLLEVARRSESQDRPAEALEAYGRLLSEHPESSQATRLASERPDLARHARYASYAGGAAVVAVGRRLEDVEDDLRNYLAASPPDEALEARIASVEGVSAGLLEAIARHGVLHPPARTGLVRLEITDAVGARRGVAFLAVPEGYDPSRRHPLLVYLHGTDASVEVARASAEELRRAYPGILILAPHADPRVGWGPNPHGLSRIETSLELVVRQYAVDLDRVAITGYSMGGHGTWDLAVRRPDLPSAILPQAGTKLDTLKKGILVNLTGMPIRFLHGARDALAPVSFAREMAKALEADGVAHEYREFPAAGHVGFPPAEVADAFRWLLAAKRPVHPTRLVLAHREPERNRAAWLRIDSTGKVEKLRLNYKDLAGAALATSDVYYEPVVVRASVEDGEIHIEGERAKKVTIFLHPALVDLEKPVIIRSGSTVLSRKRVAVDLRLVLDSLHRDRSRGYHASVQVTLR